MAKEKLGSNARLCYKHRNMILSFTASKNGSKSKNLKDCYPEDNCDDAWLTNFAASLSSAPTAPKRPAQGTESIIELKSPKALRELFTKWELLPDYHTETNQSQPSITVEDNPVADVIMSSSEPKQSKTE